MEPSPYILIADDDMDDQDQIKFAFKKIAPPKYNVTYFEDGEYLLTALQENQVGWLPGLIMLDLNMPRKGGFETLVELKSNPSLSKIPIVIFSTSKSPADKSKCLNNGASDFISKPGTYTELIQTVKVIVEKWVPVHL